MGGKRILEAVVIGKGKLQRVEKKTGEWSSGGDGDDHPHGAPSGGERV